MKTKSLTQVCNITTGKLDANAGIPNGKYPFFTCAPDPLRIDTFAFDDDVVLLAGNNAQGNFHIQRFKGKMLVLFDKDDAGIKAKNSIEENQVFIHKQNSVAVRLQHIEPSDEIIALLQKRIKFEFEIEHLLSLNFWKEIKSHGYEELRSAEELGRMFSGLVPRDKTLDSIIDELIENPDVRDTILSFAPKVLKKKRIVELLKGNTDKKATTAGLLRTVQKIESYFCGSQSTP